MNTKQIRIGGASGAWGDSPGALAQLLGAGVEYLMMDYLAEVTMSLLARARMKDPDGGYPPDAVAYLGRVQRRDRGFDLGKRSVAESRDGGGR